MASPINLLRQACAGNLAASSSLSSDGRTLILLGSSFDARIVQKLTVSDAKGGGTKKEVSYTLASIYLQLLNPSVLQYRKACDAGGVSEPVKILDKASITEYFIDAAGTSGGTGGGDDGAGAGAGSGAGSDGEVADDDAMDMSDDDDAAAASEEDSKMRDSVKFSRPVPEGKEKRARSGSREKDHREKDHRRRRSDSRGGRDKERSERSGGDRDKERSERLERSGGDRDKERSGGDRHRKSRHHRSHSKSRKEEEADDRRKSGKGAKGAKGAKTPMVPITNEQLVANLSTIVDKRDKLGAGASSKEKKDGKEDPKDDGGGGAAAAAAATTDDDGTNDPADPRQTNPAATPVLTDDEGGGLSKEDAERKEKEDRELLLSWLSPAGFQVNSPDVAAAVEADREAVRRIAALEIPVGDSASILRAGAGGEVAEKGGGAAAEAAAAPSAAGGGAGGGGVKKRDFARVLEIYQEVVVAEEKAKAKRSRDDRKRPPPPPSSSHRGKSPRASSAGRSAKPPAAKRGNPIIIVPNAMTSAITMVNAGFFLGKDAIFVPRAQAMRDPAAGKRGGTVTITRRLNQRLGGADITYDVIDNPSTRLRGPEWDRVVAVICQGASWQFKGWRYSEPVDLFSRTFGFYVGLEGAKPPAELMGWNVKTGKVSRDRRGLDNVCLASFWNGLEEFMAVHKQDLFKA